MYVYFGDELIQVSFDDKQVGQQFDLLFCGWPWKFEQPPAIDRAHPQVTLDLQAVEVLDQIPAEARLVFTDESSLTSVLESGELWHTCFGTDALAQIPTRLYDDAEAFIRVQIRRDSLYAGRLEDVIFSTLAPVLRRRGLYMMHAFAAERDGEAWLLVGESGSGKTTTGLGLIAQGWRFLANDVVLLKEQDGVIYAWPTPGGIGVTNESLGLLGTLAAFPDVRGHINRKGYYPAKALVNDWAQTAAVGKILFPEVAADGQMELRPVTSSVTLARILEASIDRWDTSTFDDHLSLLRHLARQASCFELGLGRDLEQLPRVLSQFGQGDSN